MTRFRLPFVLVVVALAVGALQAQAPQSPPPTVPGQPPTPAEQTPIFRGGVEVLPLDVTVLDSDGRQVTDLASGEFLVEVDGKLRVVVSAEYIKLTDPVAASLARTTPVKTPTPPADTSISTNGGGGGEGRAILLLVDQGNINFGAARPVMQSALTFIDRMQPNDRIGLVAIPSPGELVDFTTDHAKVREAVLRVAGRAMPEFRRFNISNTEALAIFRQSDGLLINRVMERECQGTSPADRQRCEGDIQQEAGQIIADLRRKTDSSLAGMRAVIKSLGALEGAKSVIIISEGLVLDGIGTSADDIASTAADVRASIDVLLVEATRLDASQSRLPTTVQADRALQEDGLYMLAGMARGTVHRISTTADAAFRRIEQSLAGYYLLGVEPGTDDRDGKRHRIEVKTARRGLTIQARRTFLSSEGPPPATAEEAVTRTLRSPALATALPLRLSTWTYKEPGTSRVRVIVAAEAERGSVESLEYAAGLVLATREGKVISASADPRVLTVHEADESVALYAGALTVDPGTYRLRFALANAEKHTGSVERELLAWQMNGDGLMLGDLMVAAEPVAGAPMVPSVEPRVHNGSLVALAEAYTPATPSPAAAAAAAAIGARLDVMRDESSRVLVSAPMRVIVGSSPEVRVAQGRVNVGAVPPGNYIARVSFTEGGEARGALVRPFRVVPTRVTVSGGAMPATSSAPPELLAAVLGSLPAASKDDVLGAETTDAIWSAVEQGRTGPVLAAIKTARAGEMLDGALAALSAGDQGVAAFVRGMDYLAKAQIDQAANQFTTAMRLQTGFGAARAMLGACLLISNRDREAAGLLMGVPASSAPALGRLAGEAWLKAGQPAIAVKSLEDSTAADASDERTSRALALAYALTGDAAKGLPMLTTYLDGAGSKDGPALAAGVFTTYRRHAAATDGATIEADRVKARAWTRAYLATKGPLAPLVEAWAGFLDNAK